MLRRIGSGRCGKVLCDRHGSGGEHDAEEHGVNKAKHYENDQRGGLHLFIVVHAGALEEEHERKRRQRESPEHEDERGRKHGHAEHRGAKEKERRRHAGAAGFAAADAQNASRERQQRDEAPGAARRRGAENRDGEHAGENPEHELGDGGLRRGRLLRLLCNRRTAMVTEGGIVVDGLVAFGAKHSGDSFQIDGFGEDVYCVPRCAVFRLTPLREGRCQISADVNPTALPRMRMASRLSPA